MTILNKHRLTATASIALLAGALTACSASVVDSEDAPSTSSSSESTTPATETTAPETDAPTTEDPTDTSDEPASPAADDALDLSSDLFDRETYLPLVQTTLTCEGGDLEIDQTGTIVAVTDDCGTLTVSGTGTVVLAESVDSLVVSSTGAVVLLETADSIDLTGSGTTVVWSSGAPSVTDTGVGNVTHAVAG